MPDTRRGHEIEKLETAKTMPECKFFYRVTAIKCYINAKVKIDSFNFKASLIRLCSLSLKIIFILKLFA